jgi:hypothetical protein
MNWKTATVGLCILGIMTIVSSVTFVSLVVSGYENKYLILLFVVPVFCFIIYALLAPFFVRRGIKK